MCSGFCDALRGTGPRATGTRAFFFGALRGTGPRPTGGPRPLKVRIA